MVMQLTNQLLDVLRLIMPESNTGRCDKYIVRRQREQKFFIKTRSVVIAILVCGGQNFIDPFTPVLVFGKQDDMTVGTVFFMSVLYPVCFCAEDEFEAILDSDFSALVIFTLPTMLQRAENFVTKFNGAFGVLFVGGRRVRCIDVGTTGVLMIVLNRIHLHLETASCGESPGCSRWRFCHQTVCIQNHQLRDISRYIP